MSIADHSYVYIKTEFCHITVLFLFPIQSQELDSCLLCQGDTGLLLLPRLKSKSSLPANLS